MVDIEGNIQLSDQSPSHISVLENSPTSQDSEVFQTFEAEVPAEEVAVANLHSESQVEVYEFENQAPESIQEPELLEPAKDFKEEIIEFGNSELHSGPLSYTLTIGKIDSGELRGALRSILSDPKFGLDVDVLFGSIKAGQLSIESLNPLKTSLLVQKLRSHAFEISWRQHVFSV